MTVRRNKPAGLRWLQGAFGAFSPCVTCQASRRNAYELEAWKLVTSADDQTQRAIFGATVHELLLTEGANSDEESFWNWRKNPLNRNAQRIGRFAITLNDAGKRRLLAFIVEYRQWGYSWHYIAEKVAGLRHFVRTKDIPSWLLPEDDNAVEYQKRGSSLALIFEIAERLTEQGAAK